MPLVTRLPFTPLLMALFFSITCPLWLQATETLDRSAVETKLQDFHLDQAQSVIRQLPDPAFRAFYQCHLYIYQFLATQDTRYATAFSEKWKAALEDIEKLPEEEPLRNVMLAELYGKRAMVEFFEGNYFTSLRMARSCRRQVAHNEGLFPDNVEQLKLLGLFNVVFAAVPKKYLWLTQLLGYTGDMETGMSQLERAAEESTLLPMEAHIIAFYAEKNILNRPQQALDRMHARRAVLGNNILLDFLLASAFGSMNRNDDALKLLEQRDRYTKNPAVFFIPYWDYLLGKAYYYREDYSLARRYLSLFLEVHPGNIYHSDATFRLAMAQCFSGEGEAARQSFARMLTLEASAFDEDEYALHMAEVFAEHLPGPEAQLLFRARNLFDGGYMSKALAVLRDLQEQEGQLAPAEATELYYRYGRIYHALHTLDKASTYYHQCIAQPDGEHRWMQAYACYYLGEIALEREKPEEARTYFQQALGYDDYFYQGGLENRCKVALSEIKGM